MADFEGARFRRGGVGQSEIGFDLDRALEFGQQLGEEVAGKQDIVDPELSRLRVVVGFAGEDEEDVAGADPVFGAAEAVGGVPFADHHQLIVVVVGVGISHVGLPVMDTVEHLKFEILPVEFGFQEIHGKASARGSLDPLQNSPSGFLCQPHFPALQKNNGKKRKIHLKEQGNGEMLSGVKLFDRAGGAE